MAWAANHVGAAPWGAKSRSGGKERGGDEFRSDTLPPSGERYRTGRESRIPRIHRVEDLSGNSFIHAKVELPGPCVAAIIMVVAGSEEKWFAVTGFESEEEE